MSITPGIVAFNPAQFVAQFPAFASVSTFNGTGTLLEGQPTLTITGTVSGALNVGDTVYDAASAIPAGTTVLSGSAGTYTLNQNAVASASGDGILVSAALVSNFGTATLMLNNSYRSVVQDAPTRASLLNLLTAHITYLLNGANGQPPSGVVGRISEAVQGSITVQTEFRSDSEAASFFQQSQWGAMFWQATTVYRRFRYVPGRVPCTSSWNGGWPE
ncbi:MAG: DUF4054 domain-containing protein [Steroidobacteraceae bacterium]